MFPGTRSRFQRKKYEVTLEIALPTASLILLRKKGVLLDEHAFFSAALVLFSSGSAFP